MKVALAGLPNVASSPAIGLERRLAADLARGGRFPGGPWSRFEERPASEAALARLWPEPTSRSKAFALDALAFALSPGCARRTAAIQVGPDSLGIRTLFPPPPDAGWAQPILDAEQALAGPLARAAFAYGWTVLVHPYTDGNGRLARALFQVSMARSGLISAPVLPLGPLVYANHRSHDLALRRLGVTGDWQPLLEVLVGLTEKAAAYARRHLAD
jgi:hypothetical protein